MYLGHTRGDLSDRRELEAVSAPSVLTDGKAPHLVNCGRRQGCVGGAVMDGNGYVTVDELQQAILAARAPEVFDDTVLIDVAF